MAVWRKVIVSGSTANLPSLQVDNLNSGEAVIGGGASNLSTRVISGSGAILASGGNNIQLSGSFSGSFRGDGSGLTGVTAQSSFALTFGEGIGSLGPSPSSSYNGNQPVTIVVSGAVDLTDGRHIKWDNTANKVANSLIYDDGTNVQITGSFVIISGSSSAIIVTGSVRASGGFTGSLFGTSSWATNATTATQVGNSITAGNGLTGTTFNGSAASTFDVGAGALITVNTDAVMVTTSSLTTNQVPKYSANALAGSNISDTGTQVQIAAGATSGLSVAAGGITVTAGGINVSGNSIFNGNITVAGTASFQNTDSLFVADKFISLASGSTSVTDSGLIVVTSTVGGNMSGSAFYLESTTDAAPNYGRWAVAANINATASAVTADEYMVSAKIAQASNPSVAPTWGGGTQGTGNMWITNAGDIFIYA